MAPISSASHFVRTSAVFASPADIRSGHDHGMARASVEAGVQRKLRVARMEARTVSIVNERPPWSIRSMAMTAER